MAKDKSQTTDWIASLLLQGWLGLALWMTFGLLLEGLLGYKIPAYLSDSQRRELFQLAHTHGTLLSLILIAAALCSKSFAIEIHRAARMALRLGTIFMPLGFLLAGISHPEGDPGIAIWLVPPAALLVIFGAIVIALACLKKNKDATYRD
jgi:hypothetical protein